MTIQKIIVLIYINLIKELMIKDSRIKLYQNEENKGILFTKSKGILNSNGKY